MNDSQDCTFAVEFFNKLAQVANISRKVHVHVLSIDIACVMSIHILFLKFVHLFTVTIYMFVILDMLASSN